MVIFQYNLYIFGIHLWTVLYPKLCFKEPCYRGCRVWSTLKAPFTTKADDNFIIIIIIIFFQKKTSLDISCESSAKQTIHMKYQDLFYLKNKKWKF